MKTYFTMLFILLFTMCSSDRNPLSPVHKKQAEQIRTGIRNDVVFMDFRFYMTEKQTFERFRKLVSDSVFTLTKSTVFEYKMKIDSINTRVAFHTGFYHDSLYSFSLIFKGKTKTEADFIQQKMVNRYKKDFGDPVIVPAATDETKRDYYFVSGNQQVKVEYPSQTNKTVVTYTEYSMEKRKNEDDKEIKKVKKRAENG